MDRLTVRHAYDPATGFIVAREVITLPPILASAPALDDAITQSRERGVPVIVFATADRCAPCQQFKKDALQDPRVIARLSQSDRLIAVHLEVDRQGELADRVLGSRGIPMTYRLDDGRVTATLRGQRSAADLLAWLDAPKP
jgi:thioredoxin-like negative regulator of GroEL